MSSAVNKSSTRFAPKAVSRGQRSQRRMSLAEPRVRGLSMTGRRPSIITPDLQQEPSPIKTDLGSQREPQGEANQTHISKEEQQELRASVQSAPVFDEVDEGVEVIQPHVPSQGRKRSSRLSSSIVTSIINTERRFSEVQSAELVTVQPVTASPPTSVPQEEAHTALFKRRRLTIQEQKPSSDNMAQQQTSRPANNMTTIEEVGPKEVGEPIAFSSWNPINMRPDLEQIQQEQQLPFQHLLEAVHIVERERLHSKKTKKKQKQPKESKQAKPDRVRAGPRALRSKPAAVTRYEPEPTSTRRKRSGKTEESRTFKGRTFGIEKGRTVTSDNDVESPQTTEESDLFLSSNEIADDLTSADELDGRGEKEEEEEEEEQGDELEEELEAEEPKAPPRSFVDEKGIVQIPGITLLDPEDLPKVGRGRKLRQVADGTEKKINEETFTMADLCKEIPIGETNEEFDKWEEARRERKVRREKLLEARRLAKKNGIPYAEVEVLREEEERRRQDVVERQQEGKDRFKAAERLGPSQAPKLKMGEDGVMTLDVDSIQVNRHEMNEVDNETKERLEIDKFKTVINNSSFSLRDRPERWDLDDENKFYQAISTWGSDFNLIAQLFPGRSRRQIKSKFKLEEKRNPAKLHMALMRLLPTDATMFTNATGTELDEVNEIEKELEALREAHEKQMEAETQSRERLKKSDAEQAAKREKEIYGTAANSNEEIVGHLDDINRVTQIKVEEIKIDDN